MPAPYTDIDVQYPQNPWAAVDTKERTPWYVPDLYAEYQRHAIYNRFVSTAFNHNGPTATELIVTSLMMPHVNHDPIGLRQIWLDAQVQDSFQRKITFNKYGSKMSLHAYDDLITYWKQNGRQGLRNIINQGLGYVMTNTLDKLARDAFMKSPFAVYGADAAGSSFNDITSADTATASLLQDIQLGLQTRDNPMNKESGGFPIVTCVTTPGVINDLRRQAIASANGEAFIDVHRYVNTQPVMAGEVGTFYGIRFLQSNNAMLPNSGAIIAQTTVTAAAGVHDGAPDPATTAVDSVEYVGQPSATHGVTVGDATNFAVGDYVTIHKTRTSDYGVTNGVDHEEGTALHRRIVAKTGTTGGQLFFDRPLLEDYTTDLGGGVYGYVTKATHIHSMTFMYGNDGVAMGVARPPKIVMPRPIDDLEEIYRVSWSGYLGYQPFNKNAYEVAFVAGSHRLVGPRAVQAAS